VAYQGFPRFTGDVDFFCLTAIDGVAFRQAWESRETAEIDGLKVWILSRELLQRNKAATGRPKDLEDLRQLKGDRESSE
jgi:hypothetical protein